MTTDAKKEARMLKEIKSLAPFSWDRRIEEHPYRGDSGMPKVCRYRISGLLRARRASR